MNKLFLWFYDFSMILKVGVGRCTPSRGIRIWTHHILDLSPLIPNWCFKNVYEVIRLTFWSSRVSTFEGGTKILQKLYSYRNPLQMVYFLDFLDQKRTKGTLSTNLDPKRSKETLSTNFDPKGLKMTLRINLDPPKKQNGPWGPIWTH